MLQTVQDIRLSTTLLQKDTVRPEAQRPKNKIKKKK